MEEILLHTHPIVTGIQSEYSMKWCGKLLDVRPKLKNGLPIFSIIGGNGRIEMNSIDIEAIERMARHMAHPRGRASVTSDLVKIYVQEENGNEVLMGTMTYNHIKKYQPMYDRFQYY
jgi:hypothetical protein